MRASFLLAIGAVSAFLGCGRLGFDASQTGTPDAASSSDASPADGSTDLNLVSRAVLSRYFLAEGVIDAPVASSRGDLELEVLDATNLETLSPSSGRGVRFNVVGGPDRICAPIAGSTVAAIEGMNQATLEIVADIRVGHEFRSRLAGIGIGGQWGFSLGYSSADTTIVYSMNNTQTVFGAWTVDADARDRAVYTVVYDSNETAEAERVRLYINGLLATPAPSQNIDSGMVLTVGAGIFCIGNSPEATRAPDGDIFYAALYSAALTGSEVARNSARLLEFDD